MTTTRIWLDKDFAPVGWTWVETKEEAQEEILHAEAYAKTKGQKAAIEISVPILSREGVKTVDWLEDTRRMYPISVHMERNGSYENMSSEWNYVVGA